MKPLWKQALWFACVLSILVVPIVQAQSVPQPVIRMGDWVEIGDEAFMNIIGNIDMRFSTWHNADFEDDVRDRTASRNPTSSTLTVGPGDHFHAEVRWGADFRYKKKLRTRILFETQTVFDGNLIDDRGNNMNENRADSIGTQQPEGNSPHVERFWIDYKWSPMLRTRVGADLWKQDPFGWFGDDDPNFAIFFTPNKTVEIVARWAIQTEAARAGLTNDNDDQYWTAGIAYKGLKGHTIRLDGGYFRMRFHNGGNPDATTALIVPSWKGSFGIFSGSAQVGVTFGEADGTGGQNYDVFGWGAVGNFKANLGSITPWFGFAFASADDDAGDTDLNGFHHFPHGEITLGSGEFEWGLTSPDMSDWGPSAGANAPWAGGVAGPGFTGSPWLPALGSAAHPGTTVAYSNAGTLRVAAGAHFDVLKGHRVTAYYQYVGFLDDATLIAENTGAPRTSFDKTLFHEISSVWNWRVNKHFDIRAIANVMVPGGGTKDIASTVLTCGDGTQACKGEDIAFRGTLRFRARF